jgi:hypothetical protein
MESPPTGGKCNVYIWFDKEVPFYVGIGGVKRLKSRHRNKWATSRRKESEKRNDFIQEVVFSGDRRTCEEIETFLITVWGSVVNGGILFNFTSGGDGMKNTYNIPPDSLGAMQKGRKSGGSSSMAKNHQIKDEKGFSVFAKRAGQLSDVSLNFEEKQQRSKKGLQALHSAKDENGRSLHGLKSPFAKNKRLTKVTHIASGETFTYDSATLAAKSLQLNRGDLCSCARGEIQSVKGYKAEYI